MMTSLLMGVLVLYVALGLSLASKKRACAAAEQQ
jgi:hypothetical protein